jgi:hypothetical protein
LATHIGHQNKVVLTRIGVTIFDKMSLDSFHRFLVEQLTSTQSSAVEYYLLREAPHLFEVNLLIHKGHPFPLELINQGPEKRLHVYLNCLEIATVHNKVAVNFEFYLLERRQ